ncbi:hypothetical protein HB364_02730 [Pseudoflavitalea sp. X16]|uniref:hypothetical protein n=1 Tax=Paraflavitalea devenefica TaxID=2716334 RepID=UPI00141FF74E|nr:hypothetical protein [Paraflavitalea devenefica]NII23979.1 hypothetical protein [Paraflavitalea devenefica]
MAKRLLSIFLLIRGYAAFAQDTTADSSFTATALHNAVASYHHYIDKQSRLYNGIEYIGYSPKIEGIPYFLENTWQRGSIVYDGIAYDTVKMMYDMVKDRVIILHFNGFYRLALFSEKVTSFSLMNHHFVRFEQDSLGRSPLETGFYDQLYTGPSAVLARRSKFIEETVREQLERKFVEQYHYYIYKDGNYHIIRTKKALFSLLKDRAREVKQYLRNQKLKFRKDKETTILQAATHYDSLKN